MRSADRLTGAETEKWFKKFTEDTSIDSTVDCRVELLVRLLDRELNSRLINAQIRIYKDLPKGGEWIDTILSGKTPNPFTELEKNRLLEYLCDKVIAIDGVVELIDNKGSPQKIAVDVTIKESEEQDKLAKIQGRPTSKQFKNAEDNRNIPAVRKILGINKHIVLVLNSYRHKLPSYDYLLNQLQSVANTKGNTKSLNLAEIPEGQRYIWTQTARVSPKQMWDRYSQGERNQTKAKISINACIKAIRAGYDREIVGEMLKNDPQCQAYIGRGKDNSAKYIDSIYTLALQGIDQENSRGLAPENQATGEEERKRQELTKTIETLGKQLAALGREGRYTDQVMNAELRNNQLVLASKDGRVLYQSGDKLKLIEAEKLVKIVGDRVKAAQKSKGIGQSKSIQKDNELER
jgi:hypothetical protein